MFMRTNICYACMETRRALENYSVSCPHCRQPMVELNYRVRVPKRRRKLWIEFSAWLENTYPYYKGKLKD